MTVIGKRWKFDPPAWWRLRQHIARLQPDLVQTWLFAANAYGRTAALLGRRAAHRGQRAVRRLAGRAWHQLAIDRCLAKRTDAIIVNSRGVEEFYQQQGIAGREAAADLQRHRPGAAQRRPRASRLAGRAEPAGRHAADRRRRPAVAAKADQGPDLGHRPAAR